MKRTLAALALVVAAAPAAAQYTTGNVLLSRITSPELHERLYATSYIHGVIDATLGLEQCTPAGVTGQQLTDMTRRLLEISPAQRHMPAALFVVAVAQAEWPCPKQQSRGSRL